MADAYGIPMPDLPEGTVPLECIVLLKCLDADGDVSLVERFSDGLTRWEALGISITFADGLRASLMGDEIIE